MVLLQMSEPEKYSSLLKLPRSFKGFCTSWLADVPESGWGVDAGKNM